MLAWSLPSETTMGSILPIGLNRTTIIISLSILVNPLRLLRKNFTIIFKRYGSNTISSQAVRKARRRERARRRSDNCNIISNLFP